MELIAIKITVCKCRYCGRKSVLINDYGHCPSGCPGYFENCEDFICEVPEKILEREAAKNLTSRIEEQEKVIAGLCDKVNRQNMAIAELKFKGKKQVETINNLLKTGSELQAPRHAEGGD